MDVVYIPSEGILASPVKTRGCWVVSFLDHLLHLFFEAGSLTEPDAHPSGQLVSELQESVPVSKCAPHLHCIHKPQTSPQAFLHGLWGLNSGPHACKAGPLLSKPYFQRQKITLLSMYNFLIYV